jgi:hypothetical protein
LIDGKRVAVAIYGASTKITKLHAHTAVVPRDPTDLSCNLSGSQVDEIKRLLHAGEVSGISIAWRSPQGGSGGAPPWGPEIPTINGSASAGALVPDELIDSLIESVVLPHNPLARAVLICNLLREMCAAVVWLHGTEMTRDDAAHEVASLRQSVAAAQDHQRQMETFGADGAANGGHRWAGMPTRPAGAKT